MNACRVNGQAGSLKEINVSLEYLQYYMEGNKEEKKAINEKYTGLVFDMSVAQRYQRPLKMCLHFGETL